MTHTIAAAHKIRRAWIISGMPNMPTIQAAISADLHPEMVERLSDLELAEVIGAAKADKQRGQVIPFRLARAA